MAEFVEKSARTKAETDTESETESGGKMQTDRERARSATKLPPDIFFRGERKGTVNCRTLLRELARMRRAVCRAYLVATRTVEKDGDASDGELWLVDHYSFLREEFSNVCRELPHTGRLTSIGKAPFPYASARKFFRFLDQTETELDEPLLAAWAHECDESCEKGLSFRDLFSLSITVRAAALTEIGYYCAQMPEAEKTASSASLARAVRRVRFLSILNFSPIVENSKLFSQMNGDPSGAFSRMTESSRYDLCARIGKAARKQKTADGDLVATMLSAARNAKTEKERYIGRHLPKSKKKRMAKYVYFGMLSLFSLFGTVLFCTLTRSYLAPLIVFPTVECAKILTDALFARFYRENEIVPSLELSEIPDEAPTLCVITSLLQGTPKDDELFLRLERIYNANAGKNIRFGLLADLPDSRHATESRDSEIVTYADERIEALNTKYGGGFIFFVRPRSYSKSEECFMAYERKRGAVSELVRLIRGKETNFDRTRASLRLSFDFLRTVRYVITLDADTNLGLDKAKELVGKMLHPENRPIFDSKRQVVVDGYGVMQPRMMPELSSARATPFSRLMCGGGGVDLYAGACFEVYQSLFGAGNFCGKGIFDVEAFEKTIDGADAFPEDTVLSHDILEGERLRTALLCDTVLTDGFPKNELSFLKRKHRWIRGDLQNLLFVRTHIKKNGKTYTNTLSPLSRAKILDNARRAVTPIASLLLLLGGMLLCDCARALAVCAFFPYIVPFLCDVVTSLCAFSPRVATRRFFSTGVTAGLWQSFLRMLFYSSMLAKDALMSLSATFTTAYRMLISKKKLLEWVTAAQSDSGKATVSVFIWKNIWSAILGALLFVTAPSGFLRLAGLAFFLLPPICAATSENRFCQQGERGKLSEKYRNRLYSYAADIWKYFEKTVTAHDRFLPPDNLQLSPHEKLAHRTSPTNIGLYLVGTLAARDLDFIDSTTLCRRVRETLDTVEHLEKARGNLYNWYDTRTLAVLPPNYVSSVDSGNFVGCLYTLRAGLSEYADEEAEILELLPRITALIENTDFSFLYNSSRRLFSVGARIGKDTYSLDSGCYDFLMSESRILSYIAVANRRVPKAHWERLGRPLATSRGYIGLLSWSGTTFEYFMPTLFMPIRKGSLQYEAMVFACKAQQETRAARGVWGISESGYFAFDDELNYRYKAFGVPKLRVKNESNDELVISPYSSFLTLAVSIRKTLSNLSRLASLGLYGKFGFYEACDFTPSRVKNGFAPVKSYMSHHMGMSLSAIANALDENSMVRRFMSDPKLDCARELLEEKIPVDAVIRRKKTAHMRRSYREKPFSDSIETYREPSFEKPRAACISDGKTTLSVSDCGHVRLQCGKCFFWESSFETDEYLCRLPSLYAYVKRPQGVFGLSPLAQGNTEAAKYSLSYSESVVVQSAEFSEREIHTLEYTLSPDDRSLARLRFSAQGIDTEENEYCFFAKPILSEKSVFEAHPAFSGLFIEAFRDEEENVLLYRRRPRAEHEEERWFAVAPTDKACRFSFETQCEKLPHDFPNRLFSEPLRESVGACLEPCLCLRLTSHGRGELLFAMTHTQDEAIEAICRARKESFDETREALSRTALQLVLGAGISTNGKEKSVCRLLDAVCFGAYRKAHDRDFVERLFEAGRTFTKEALWKFGISGDLPIAVIEVKNAGEMATVEPVVRAYKLLLMKNIRFDLIFLYDEHDRYEQKTLKKLKKMLRLCGADGYVGRERGGIRLLCTDEIEANGNTETSDALRFCAVNRACDRREPKKELLLPLRKGRRIRSDENGFRVYGGVFRNGGFAVDSDEAETPYAHILSGENISSVVTHDSLGYTFHKNAALRRITPYDGRAYSNQCGEHLLYETDGVTYDLAACARRVFFSVGKAEYEGQICDFSYRMTVSCSSKMPYKCVSVRFSGAPTDARLYYYAIPCMGRERSLFVKRRRSPFETEFLNPFAECFSDYVGFLTVHTDALTPRTKESESCAVVCGGTCSVPNGRVDFFLGARKKGARFDKIVFDRQRDDPETFSENLLPAITLTPYNTTSQACASAAMFNTFLPYDAIVSRFLARSGLYQSGGAYGFRDQLQDAVLLFYSDKRRALSHLYRAAACQFFEGDVLHWWHAATRRGVRTRCSDDYLWLVFACAEYAELFGNCDFIKTEIPYCDGMPLAPEKNEEYMKIQRSEKKESLLYHCIRALDLGLSRTGAHGLSLIGSGDWCDGFNLVGKNGKGESVWVTMFLVALLQRFVANFGDLLPNDRRERYKESADRLSEAVLRDGYNAEEKTFLRGYYDDGTPLGTSSCDACQLDILPQAFASIAGAADPKTVSEALLVACEKLYDPTYRVMKLFTPPFDLTSENAGYIKGYPPGIRENGGQYTHGALFGAWGCFDCAEKIFESDRELARKLSTMGGEILLSSCPAYRCSYEMPDFLREGYKTEPYAVAADIYENEAHRGRGGWTHYTGAAGWMYRLILRYVLGLRFSNATNAPILSIRPDRPFPLPELLDRLTVSVGVFGFDFKIRYLRDGVPAVFVDGKKCADGAIAEIGVNARTVVVHF